DKGGNMIRPPSQFRSQISSEHGSKFQPEAGRYHLYVSYACPWGGKADSPLAHRTLIVRKLKGLENLISFSVVHYRWPIETGWRFPTVEEAVSEESFVPDPLHKDVTRLAELYEKSSPGYDGRWTVPVLWDKKTDQIVNNESSEIIRILNTAFDELLDPTDRGTALNLYPEPFHSRIDEHNDWHYDNINNGVYKSGFAKSQVAYEKAVNALFIHLDRAELHLASQDGPYYFCEQLTETDIRLFVTIVRFDPVYVQHFKCNIRDIRSGYPAIHKWLRYLYWNHDAFKSTTNFNHIKRHYLESHVMINPLSIVPVGPIPYILRPDEEVAAASNRSNTSY
ncbi:glutathione S-transferase, partial [Ilyonectria robusta]|uniref:glutathione S-transferase n=1 Tax=Ilyonectria robusta TaxID=1079257 RepID=UPI001E8E6884